MRTTMVFYNEENKQVTALVFLFCRDLTHDDITDVKIAGTLTSSSVISDSFYFSIDSKNWLLKNQGSMKFVFLVLPKAIKVIHQYGFVQQIPLTEWQPMKKSPTWTILLQVLTPYGYQSPYFLLHNWQQMRKGILLYWKMANEMCQSYSNVFFFVQKIE